MLDPRFENLHLVSFIIGREQGVAIVQEYDERSLYLMFLKCYHHLQLVFAFENEFIEQIMDANCNLDIFEMVAGTNEPLKEIVKRKLLIFRCYQVDVKKITCLLK